MLHRFHNEQTRGVGVHVYGRRLHEVMLAWETYAEEIPSAPEHELEFARIWKGTPKVVFSPSLESLEGNATLAGGDVAGGGTPFFPPLDERMELKLVETRTFGSGAVYLRYCVR